MPIERFSRRYAHVAVVRHAKNGSEQIGKSVRALLAHDAEAKIRYDMAGRDLKHGRDEFYCLGMINYIYRDAGLAEPFIADARASRDSAEWDAWVEQALGWDIVSMPTANSVLTNSAFTLVTEWCNPAGDARILAVDV